MATTTETTQEKSGSEKKEYRSLYDMVRRMMLAGIGAVALKHDEMEEFMDKLVDRGEIAKRDAEDLMKEMRERHKKYHQGEEHPAHKKVSEFMERFSMPSKDDIDELNKKLADLEKKIDELTKTKEKTSK